MSRRGRVAALIVLAVVAFLFIGRWATLVIAERWWAETISPAAGRFAGEVQALRLLLDLAGILAATAWFTGNLYIVYRTIGSVHVSRRVANLEINEALTSRALLTGTIAGGVLLGVLTGLGTSRWWHSVVLAVHGVSYGTLDPVLGKDLGLYVAQLPLWRRAHGAALLLVLLALGTCFLLYLLVGAVRWSARRPAVSDHARRHLGWLLAALALALAWGYWLEPYEAVAGIDASLRLDIAAFSAVVANALTGVALAAALVSAAWALRPRHLLMTMAWLILAFSSIVGHHVLPAFASVRERAIGYREDTVIRLERTAFGLARMEEAERYSGDAVRRPPAPVSLWSPEQVERIGEGDSSRVVAINQSVLRVRGRRLPVWITVRSVPGDTTVVNAYADDRVAPSGGPLSFRSQDTLAYPGTVRLLSLPAAAIRPQAPEFVVNQDSAGVPAGRLGRRVVLAWARQAGALLAPVPAGAHLAWHLDPLGRLQAIAPHVAWGQPTAHVVGDQLVWISDGYVASATFPVVERVPWRDRNIGALDVPFLATINGESGETRIYRRQSASPLGRAWQEITGAMALPWTDLPPEILAVLVYPDELFQVTSRVLERPHWLGGRQAGRPGFDPVFSLMPTAWRRADTTLVQVAVFEATAGRGVTAVLTGYRGGPEPRLVLRRIDETEAFGSPRALDRNWKRFATFEQLRDSLRSVNADAEPSSIRVWVERHGLGAYQVIYGVGPERQRSVAWVNIAARDSLGAGRTVVEAWENLLGESAPLLSGGFTGRLGEARQWMAIADSAFKRGDWSAFGRAFEALREVLKPE